VKRGESREERADIEEGKREKREDQHQHGVDANVDVDGLYGDASPSSACLISLSLNLTLINNHNKFVFFSSSFFFLFFFFCFTPFFLSLSSQRGRGRERGRGESNNQFSACQFSRSKKVSGSTAASSPLDTSSPL